MAWTIEPNPWTLDVQTWTTETAPWPLTWWQQVTEYLKALYR